MFASKISYTSILGSAALLLATVLGGANLGDRQATSQPHPTVAAESAADSPAATEAEVPANQPEYLDPIDAIIEAARAYEKHGRLRQALSLCRQVLNTTPDAPVALDLAVDLLMKLSTQAEDAKDYNSACAYIAEAEALVARAHRTFELSKPDPRHADLVVAIYRMRDLIADRRAALAKPLRDFILKQLEAADQMAREASPWYWSNDLDKLSEALSLLREVRDVLPFAEDKSLMNKYFAVYGYIRTSVPERQWNTVQARAGMLHQN